MMAKSFQQTRHARRLYVGGLSANFADEDEIRTFFDNIIASGLRDSSGRQYVLSVYIDHKKCFIFVELISIALTTACLELDGLMFKNIQLRILRANEFKPELLREHMDYLNESPMRLDLTNMVFGCPPHSSPSTNGGGGGGGGMESSFTDSLTSDKKKLNTMMDMSSAVGGSSYSQSMTERNETKYFRPANFPAKGVQQQQHEMTQHGKPSRGNDSFHGNNNHSYPYRGDHEERKDHDVQFANYQHQSSSSYPPSYPPRGPSRLDDESVSSAPSSAHADKIENDKFESLVGIIKPTSVIGVRENSITLIGFPFDTDANGGTIVAQQKIRSLFLTQFRGILSNGQGLALDNPEFGVNLVDKFKIYDVGNVAFPKNYVVLNDVHQHVTSTLRSTVAQVMEASSVPFVVGGNIGQSFYSVLGARDSLNKGNRRQHSSRKVKQSNSYRHSGHSEAAAHLMDDNLSRESTSTEGSVHSEGRAAELEGFSMLQISAVLDGGTSMLKFVGTDQTPLMDTSDHRTPPPGFDTTPCSYIRFGAQGDLCRADQARRIEKAGGCEIVWYSKHIRATRASPVDMFRQCLDKLSAPVQQSSLGSRSPLGGDDTKSSGKRRKVIVTLDLGVLSGVKGVASGGGALNSGVRGLTIDELLEMSMIAGAHADVVLFDCPALVFLNNSEVAQAAEETSARGRQMTRGRERSRSSSPASIMFGDFQIRTLVDLFYRFAIGFAERPIVVAPKPPAPKPKHLGLDESVMRGLGLSGFPSDLYSPEPLRDLQEDLSRMSMPSDYRGYHDNLASNPNSDYMQPPRQYHSDKQFKDMQLDGMLLPQPSHGIPPPSRIMGGEDNSHAHFKRGPDA